MWPAPIYPGWAQPLICPRPPAVRIRPRAGSKGEVTLWAKPLENPVSSQSISPAVMALPGYDPASNGWAETPGRSPYDLPCCPGDFVPCTSMRCGCTPIERSGPLERGCLVPFAVHNQNPRRGICQRLGRDPRRARSMVSSGTLELVQAIWMTNSVPRFAGQLQTCRAIAPLESGSEGSRLLSPRPNSVRWPRSATTIRPSARLTRDNLGECGQCFAPAGQSCALDAQRKGFFQAPPVEALQTKRP